MQETLKNQIQRGKQKSSLFNRVPTIKGEHMAHNVYSTEVNDVLVIHANSFDQLRDLFNVCDPFKYELPVYNSIHTAAQIQNIGDQYVDDDKDWLLFYSGEADRNNTDQIKIGP
jgi:hypothetical protein